MLISLTNFSKNPVEMKQSYQIILLVSLSRAVISKMVFNLSMRLTMKADARDKQIGSIPVPCTDTDISFLMFYWIYPFFCL